MTLLLFQSNNNRTLPSVPLDRVENLQFLFLFYSSLSSMLDISCSISCPSCGFLSCLQTATCDPVPSTQRSCHFSTGFSLPQGYIFGKLAKENMTFQQMGVLIFHTDLKKSNSTVARKARICAMPGGRSNLQQQKKKKSIRDTIIFTSLSPFEMKRHYYAHCKYLLCKDREWRFSLYTKNTPRAGHICIRYIKRVVFNLWRLFQEPRGADIQ